MKNHNVNFESLQKTLSAVSFASRAHESQYRRDKKTPYVSHVYRVALILRHVFGVSDERLITAAILHDTIEDTTTDFDDLNKKFGHETASWVAFLSKDMRLEEEPREEAYRAQLLAAPDEVKIIKLADLYDNVLDTCEEKLAETIFKANKHLANFKKKLSPALSEPLGLLEELIQYRTRQIPAR